jgi:hypothetical protein
MKWKEPYEDSYSPPSGVPMQVIGDYQATVNQVEEEVDMSGTA